MSPKPWKLAAVRLVSSAFILGPLVATAAVACDGPRGGGITINKPVTINKSVNIYKPTTINKEINIYKPVTINKNVEINKTINNSKYIDASKNIVINKNITINKGGSGGGSADASAWAQAWASASAQASASAAVNMVIYNGSNEYVTVNNRGAASTMGAIETSGRCEMQEASVIKSIHAVCIAPDGRELPASHMIGDTWVDTGFEDEILRCIPGARLKIVVGEVTQSDQGMAATYSAGQTIECAENEALRHFKGGMLKCVPKVAVKDCTERTNLRRWGTGDLFFTYRTTVCVAPSRTVQASQRELELTGMSLDGGVGDQ